jgi:cytochrome P450
MTTIFLLLLLGLVLFVVVYLIYNRFSYFSNRSIPSPPISSLIFGHLSELWSAKLYSEQIQKWSRQYGSIYGLFEGTRPVYVISDIKFIEEVFITQFARFYSRGPHLGSEILGHEYDNLLSTNTDQIWKRQRKILNPTFSGAKIKRLLPTVQTCVNIFMEKIITIPNKTILNIYEMYKRLTIDVIWKFSILLLEIEPEV